MVTKSESGIFSEFQGEIIQRRVFSLQEEQEDIFVYKKVDVLNKGGFSICYKCINIKTKEIFCLKEMEPRKNQNMFDDEIEIHKPLNHPNIVKLIDTFENNEKLYLLLEYCENKDLLELLINRKKLKEVEVQYYITNLIEAVKYLHEHRIVHKDIKPSNIFLTDKLEVKLGDFGLSRKISRHVKLKEQNGTIYYTAPEILEGDGYSFEVDIWAIGIIIYQLILGKYPFYDNYYNKNILKEQIINVDYEFPENAVISNAAKDLIKQILVKEPKQRPTLNQILQHDFFQLGRAIPKLLPLVFKDKEPSINYIKNFMPDADDNGIVNREIIYTQLNLIKHNKNCKEHKKLNKNIYITKCYFNPGKNNYIGLIFILNNNILGFCFNDGTQILLAKNKNHFIYLSKKECKYYNLNHKFLLSEDGLFKKVETVKNFLSLKNQYHPPKKPLGTIIENKNEDKEDLCYTSKIEENDILKKEDINKIQSFQGKENYIFNYELQILQHEIDKLIIDEKDYDEYLERPIYVKKYCKLDKSSFVFQLNNKICQVYFLNGESILFSLSKKMKEIKFIDFNDKYIFTLEKNKYNFQEINEKLNKEKKDKLKYTLSLLKNKNIFKNFIKPKNSTFNESSILG